MRNGEDQGQVTCDSFLLKNLGSLNPLPRSGNLDKNAALVNSFLFVELDKPSSLGNCSLGIEGETSIDFSRDVSWNLGCDLGPEVDGASILRRSPIAVSMVK